MSVLLTVGTASAFMYLLALQRVTLLQCFGFSHTFSDTERSQITTCVAVVVLMHSLSEGQLSVI